ncbi:MAG: AraC family transcriptional regulator [Novosphingobium sp.]
MQPLGEPLRTLNCWFDRDAFEAATGIDEPGWIDRAGEFLPVSNRNLETMMRRIHLEIAQPGFGSEQMIEAASTMILVEMARLGRKPRDAATIAAGLAPWQMRRVRERISASLEQGYPRILELAGLCGVSRSHFMRMFKASTGQPVQGYIAAERLSAARRLLREDGHSVKEIAAILGFSSAGHFTNAFRRDAQITPSQFRRYSRADRFGPHPEGAAGLSG